MDRFGRGLPIGVIGTARQRTTSSMIPTTSGVLSIPPKQFIGAVEDEWQLYRSAHSPIT